MDNYGMVIGLIIGHLFYYGLVNNNWFQGLFTGLLAAGLFSAAMWFLGRI